MDRPKFGYAECEGNELAYATFGSAQHDLLYVPVHFGSFDVLFDEPALSRLVLPMSRYVRIIAFDSRGIGMSSHASPAPVEDQVADVEAVLDAAGSTRAALMATGLGAAMAVMFAASHPARVSHLILIHGQARANRAEGYEWALSAAERRSRLIEPVLASWGDGEMLARMFYPVTAAEDPRLERLIGASPKAVRLASRRAAALGAERTRRRARDPCRSTGTDPRRGPAGS